MKIKELKANTRNPRKISPEQKERLKKSMDKFGDLGCLVYNERTGRLVGGHQRTMVLPPDATLKITRLKEPSPVGTVAEGYIEHGGEKFKYRAVDWSEEVEAEAMLAANSAGGEWDKDLLKVLAADFPKIDFEIAGFPELAPLPSIQVGAATLQPPGEEDVAEEETDEEYVANTPQTTEQIPVENPGASFDKVEEKMEVVGKRHVIIIDCASDEMKQLIKGKISEVVLKEGGKFF